MALTPDDVVTKQFQHVRFKEGFDPDEVDDFLDEIVVEWRKTIAENDELKAKLAAYESGSEAPAAATQSALQTNAGIVTARTGIASSLTRVVMPNTVDASTFRDCVAMDNACGREIFPDAEAAFLRAMISRSDR